MIAPMALADPAKPSVSVWYHDVPVPRAAEVEQHSSSLADLACRTGLLLATCRYLPDCYRIEQGAQYFVHWNRVRQMVA